VPAGDNVVRLLPPLTLSAADMDDAVERMDAALSGLETELGHGRSAAE
jgi:acetylornithine/N-succinyldiaminopimelate aminotransferase